MFGVEPGKVRAIPLGVGDEYRELPPAAVAQGLAPYGLETRRYSLAVGTLEPRKNLLRVMQAYQALPLSVAREFPLIIVGGRGWLTGPIERAMARLETERRARYLGYVDQAFMPVLYAGAKMLLYPSLYARFGLPPL